MSIGKLIACNCGEVVPGSSEPLLTSAELDCGLVVAPLSNRVKTTMLEQRDQNKNTKAHSYEVTKIELLDDISNSPRREMVDITPSISAAKLLKNIDIRKNLEKTLYEHETESRDN